MALVSIGEFARQSRLSARALRLYAELGLLLPARVDPDSGYRWYAEDQLDRARLVASLRQIGVPLARIRVILDLGDDTKAAARVADYWVDTEVQHAIRRNMAALLVDRLNGKSSIMYEVATRTMPARNVLSLQRHVLADELLSFGKSFIHRFMGGTVPRVPGVVGAPFVIYYGLVSEDSDGPIEWCKPVPDDQAAEIAAQFPDLVLRVEPAHEEAFVHLESARDVDGAQVELVRQAMDTWAADQQRVLTGPARQIFISRGRPAEGPSCDFAVALN